MIRESHSTTAPSESARDGQSAPANLGAVTGTLLIVANMIGVGVFTTTGYMAGEIPSPSAILLAWLVGGVAALCGALTYAELGAALPQNGGEYRLLSRIFHPAAGFIAACISQIVGFAAPLALFAGFFGRYLHAVWPKVPALPAGLVLIVCVAVIHSMHIGAGNRFHNASTLGKVALIVLFIAAGAFWGDMSRLVGEAQRPLHKVVASSAFAVQLVYVSFSYSGWNAAAYLAGEFRRPQRDILLSVVAGTCIVTLLYLGLNAVYLAAAPLEELAGKDEVGHVAAIHLFGTTGGKLVSLLIVGGLVSTVSANLMAGPRVLEALGADWPMLGWLAVRRAAGGPIVAITLQAVFAMTMLVTLDVRTLLEYIGVTLSLCAAATVAGAIVLRVREPDLPRPYRTWGYPITPVLFVMLEGWMIVFTLHEKPIAAAASAATVAIGLVLYAVVRIVSPPRVAANRDISDIDSAS